MPKTEEHNIKMNKKIKREKTSNNILNNLNSSDRSKILILHASTGSGHKTAAESIAIAMQEICQNKLKGDKFENAEILVLDILDFLLCSVDGNTAAHLYTGKLAPIFDISWRYNFTGRILWGGGTGFLKTAFRKFKKFAMVYKPDLVICTHMLAANVAAGACQECSCSFPVVSVPTDYETEGLWPHKYSDLFCVATESMIETLEDRRVPRAKILKTGLPVEPGFTKTYDKLRTRKTLGLPIDKKIVLVVAGASEPHPYVNLRDTLNKAIDYIKLMDWMHFVIVCGDDEDYKNYLETRCRENLIDNVTIIGYTKKIPQFMAASDICLCKAGGLTVTECICAKLPMLLIGKCFAQEHINLRYLTSVGVAYHATTYKELIEILCRITSNEVLYNALITNIEAIRKPNAAYDIAKAGLYLAGCTKVEADVDNYLRLARTLYYSKYKGYPFVSIYIGNKPSHSR